MVELSRRQMVLAACGSAMVVAVATLRAGNPDGTPRRGRGTRTRFGSVAVLSAARRAHSAGHAGRSVVGAHQSEVDLFRVDVEVHNGLGRPLLFSPGQFRLRLGPRGATVTPFDAGAAAGALTGGSTLRTWVSYLVPRGASELRVEFTDAAPSGAITVPVGQHQPRHENQPGHADQHRREGHS